MLGLIAAAVAQERPFGMDVAIGPQVGAVLGEWPDAGVHGSGGARVDVFPVPASAPGPRVGVSVWGRTSVWPQQTHTPDDGEPAQFGLLHYGLSAAIRHDPAAPVSGVFSFGFSRMDLTGYEGGFHTVPFFVIDGGVRQRLGPFAFLDYTAQTGWGSARGLDGQAEEWWLVGAGIALGVHTQ